MGILESLESRLNKIECLLLDLKYADKTAKQQEIPDRCDLKQALDFLNHQGYKITKSQLYKFTSTNAIPCKGAGSRLVFSRKELLVWIESQTFEKNKSTEVTLALARSARRKQKVG